MGQPDPPKVPKAPDPSQTYQAGVDVFLKNLPALLQAEQSARTTYDPQRIQEQQSLQSQFGPTQYAQMLEGFKTLDPTYYANREAFGKGVASDYALGSKLSPGEVSSIQQNVRGSQAARGNIDGGAAGVAEAYAVGDRGMALEQQRTQNLLGFLAAPTIPQLAGSVPPISADQSFSYVNPSAGYQGQQFGLQNYQNILGAQSLINGGGAGGVNPWATAAGGAASGAALGTAVYPGIGTAVGAIGGGVAGYFSDRRLKTNIKKVGVSSEGTNIYQFRYPGIPATFSGVMADEVEHIPGAVSQRGGYSFVDYSKVDVPFERVS